MRHLWYDDVFCDFPKLNRLRFAGVIFGKTSSLFLLNGTSRKHIGNSKYDKVLVEKIDNSFYVDDFSWGDNSIEIYKKLRIRFPEGYFNLRKWRTYDAVLKKLLSETAQNDIKPEKILGVLWDEIDDTLIFVFKEIVELRETQSATKRIILKILAMFFDTIGILQVLVFKNTVSESLKKIFNWDEVISEEFKEKWKMMIDPFNLTVKFKISRKIVSLDEVDQLEKLELHRFSNASQQS